MLIKAGVNISRLRPEIRKKLCSIEQVVKEVEGKELVITETYGGNHMASSLHYADLAVDIRIEEFGQLVKCRLNKVLGRDYDVVDEINHIHIEYDPKVKKT